MGCRFVRLGWVQNQNYMRTIKFRVFTGEEMIYSTDNVTKFSNATFHKVNMADTLIEVEKVAKMHIMLYTGLRDFYGDYIYEGDILQTDTGYATVVWDDAAFALKSEGSEAVDYEHSSKYSQYVIVGNIHQKTESFSLEDNLKADA